MSQSYDDVIFTWGKFKGVTLGNILRTNPQYLKWVSSQEFLPDEWVDAAKLALENKDISHLKLPRVKTSVKHNTKVQNKSTDVKLFVDTVDKRLAYISMPYDRALIEQFKYEIDGRVWNKKESRWEFPIVHLPKIKKIFPQATYSQNAQKLLDSLLDRREKLDELRILDDTDITIKGLKIKPYGYQNTGIKFVETAGGRALIADAPGLGKTLQSIAYAQLHNRKTLIVCPLSVVINWKREILKFVGKNAVVWDSKGYDGHLNSQFHIIILRIKILFVQKVFSGHTLNVENIQV
jgi:SNF2 family DNA or RNA helicase